MRRVGPVMMFLPADTTRDTQGLVSVLPAGPLGCILAVVASESAIIRLLTDRHDIDVLFHDRACDSDC